MVETPISRLPAFTDDGELNVVIETPKGCRNKYSYDESRGLFMLKKTLPRGMVFPFDFGFVPGTVGGDGDPLDLLLLMDEPSYPGVCMTARLVGVIEAEQTERDGKTERNDRLIAIATDSHDYGEVKTLKELNPVLLEELKHFFVSYNEMAGKVFKPLSQSGPSKAKDLVEQGVKKAKERK